MDLTVNQLVVQSRSTITCPNCGHQETEVMPTDMCQYFYDCKGCGSVLRPKAGDCCVFCTYGSVPCPSIQECRMVQGGCNSCETGNLLIRCERSSDADSICRLHEVAFGGHIEGNLVDALRAAGDLVASWVSLDGARLVGHVAFSRMQAPFRALGLGPVSVEPERQRSGIGSQLIRTGLAWAKNEAWEGVFVVGNPTYYQRFGFSAEQAKGFQSRYSGPYLMALSFTGAQLPVASGRIEYAPAFAALE